MIKTPVSYDERFDYLVESDGRDIAYGIHPGVADEIVKRINMHDELVKSLTEMCEIVGSNFCQNMEIKRKYKISRELLEKCKW